MPKPNCNDAPNALAKKDPPFIKATGFCLKDQADGLYYEVTLNGGALVVGPECTKSPLVVDDSKCAPVAKKSNKKAVETAKKAEQAKGG